MRLPYATALKSECWNEGAVQAAGVTLMELLPEWVGDALPRLRVAQLQPTNPLTKLSVQIRQRGLGNGTEGKCKRCLLRICRHTSRPIGS